ncbi:MAG: nucleotidyltransferase family protein [Muribaculaceae bacterium]|nr:nucleotidyltransferase family protein [Muribaculaceae bacterium]MDE5844588.1 nucleotidyltransferase family protein [Muribaculaceae bacterium]MDE5858197.1 nucleotidyltransferase family protein [Muribaculaceae bacterium]
MNALIFAAGLGTRLRPLTNDRPKALVEVGGVPMLQHVIMKLKNAGINKIVVNVHHFAPKIVEFLNCNDNFGLDIQVSDETDKLLETGGGILKAHKLLGDEPFIVHNADILTDFPIKEMIECHQKSNADVTLLADDRKTSRYFFFNGTNRLVGWGNVSEKKFLPEGFTPDDTVTPLAFGGVHILNPTVFKPLKRYAENNSLDAFSIVPFYVESCQKLMINGYTPSEKYQWIDIGKPESLAVANSLFEK